MPFKDPAARAAYMKRYWDDYLSRPDKRAGTKREAARLRKAEWAARNRARLTAKKRQQRRAKTIAERVGLAIEVATQCDMSQSGATRRTAGRRAAA